MRIELKRVPTISEVAELAAKLRELKGIDQVIMSPVFHGRPWFDVTLHHNASGAAVRNEIKDIVKKVNHDLCE